MTDLLRRSIAADLARWESGAVPEGLAAHELAAAAAAVRWLLAELEDLERRESAAVLEMMEAD